MVISGRWALASVAGLELALGRLREGPHWEMLPLTGSWLHKMTGWHVAVMQRSYGKE